MNFLSIIILSPIVAAIALIFSSERRPGFIKVVSGIFLGLPLLISTALLFLFDRGGVAMQFTDELIWIKSLGIKYYVGVDGISVLFLFMACFVCAVAFLLSLKNTVRVKEYFILLLIESSALAGIFTAIDALLFYAFVQLSLLPLFLMVSIWGGSEKIFASRKFILYAVSASILILAPIVVCYSYAGEAGVNLTGIALAASSMPAHIKSAVFISLCAGFVVISGVFPFHSWVCKSAYEAPTPVSIILSAVWLKAGFYAMIRFLFGFDVFSPEVLRVLFSTLGCAGGIYGAVYCAGIKNIRQLAACSTVFYGGLFMLAFASFEYIGLEGMVYNMLSHSLLMVMLFMISDSITETTTARSINELGALSGRMPVLSFFAAASAFGALAFPGTGTFAGSFLSLLGSFKANPLPTSLFFAAYFVYAGVFLRFLQEVFYVEKNPAALSKGDLGFNNIWLILIIFLMSSAAGLYPKLIIDILNQAVSHLFVK